MRIFSVSVLIAGLLISCGQQSTVKELNLNRVKGVRGTLAPIVKGNKVTFRVKAEDATFVTLSGSFNGWNPRVAPMNRKADGVWSITIPLKQGRTYQYKFNIDGFWVADPDNPDTDPDGFGGVNSKIKVEGDKK